MAPLFDFQIKLAKPIKKIPIAKFSQSGFLFNYFGITELIF